jgi:hypothetical protein
MASNDDCTGITIKGSASDNGVIWAWISALDRNHLYLANRYCSDCYMSADDTLGHQWKTRAPGANGWFQALD